MGGKREGRKLAGPLACFRGSTSGRRRHPHGCAPLLKGQLLGCSCQILVSLPAAACRPAWWAPRSSPISSTCWEVGPGARAGGLAVRGTVQVVRNGNRAGQVHRPSAALPARFPELGTWCQLAVAVLPAGVLGFAWADGPAVGAAGDPYLVPGVKMWVDAFIMETVLLPFTFPDGGAPAKQDARAALGTAWPRSCRPQMPLALGCAGRGAGQPAARARCLRRAARFCRVPMRLSVLPALHRHPTHHHHPRRLHLRPDHQHGGGHREAGGAAGGGCGGGQERAPHGLLWQGKAAGRARSAALPPHRLCNGSCTGLASPWPGQLQ